MFKWMNSLLKRNREDANLAPTVFDPYHIQRPNHPQTFKMIKSINSKGE